MNAHIIESKRNPKLKLPVIPGHFATRHSHNNHYLDIISMKHEHMTAREVAVSIAQRYSYVTTIDTIVCMDGSEVIGAFLARHLAKKDRFNVNEDKNINVVTPEHESTGQLLFRDNIVPMVAGKNVLLLISTVNSSRTVRRALECVQYYGGSVQGIATVFSTMELVDDVPVYCLFTPEDIPGYVTSDPKECPMCKAGQKIDALANSYGLSKL